MYSTLATLLDRLDRRSDATGDVIAWSCPVPSFGDLPNAVVATVGLNPSNREFVDDAGEELDGPLRRFHTLNSLRLSSWAEASGKHLDLILESCQNYFTGNPYDRWFKKLDYVLHGTNTSFYGSGNPGACHLDLIPYATTRKWTDLTTRQQAALLESSFDTLGMLLRDSRIRVLILNGQSVVDRFEEVSEVKLERQEMAAWALPRNPRPNVIGFSYVGKANRLSGIELPHEITVLGYNHNLQSSFGVTNEVMLAIRDWISRVVGKRFE